MYCHLHCIYYIMRWEQGSRLLLLTSLCMGAQQVLLQSVCVSALPFTFELLLTWQVKCQQLPTISNEQKNLQTLQQYQEQCQGKRQLKTRQRISGCRSQGAISRKVRNLSGDFLVCCRQFQRNMHQQDRRPLLEAIVSKVLKSDFKIAHGLGTK